MIKILAIDDHLDNLISLRAIIEDTFPDSTIFTAQDGQHGLELIIAHDPDVILLDVVMPGMDGFEVCRRIKEDVRISDIPVIFLTALGSDKRSRLKALEIGADAFLSKPIDEAELTAQIKAMLIVKHHHQKQKYEKEYLTALVTERTEELLKELKERTQAEELLLQSNELNNSLLQTIPFGMDILDENGNIIFISENFKKLIGEYSINRKCWEVICDKKERCTNCPLEKPIKIGETNIIEVDGILGGRSFQISHTGMMFKGRKAILEMFQDITEMKRSREELVLAKEQAVESNKLKTAFLNNMSHEIRTPMNHIIGFASLMQEAAPADKDLYAEIILKSSNQLLSLIEDVIQLSRLQSEKIRIDKREFLPAELVNQVIKYYSNGNVKNSNLLISSIPENFKNVTIVTDLEKLNVILMNLVSNAVKFTFQGTIETGFKVDDDKVTFFVKDSGTGILTKEQDRIFDTFYRGENALTLVIGGAGLGLSIVREYIKALRGSIEVESTPGKGSIFTFSIPVQFANNSGSLASTAVIGQEVRKLSILIADDEEINYLLLEILLKDVITKIDHASNGKMAHEMAHQQKYDLIFMDLRMPEVNGYESTKALKRDFPETPVIALSAFTSQEEMELARLAGCDDFIAKPVKKQVLFDAISKFGYKNN